MSLDEISVPVGAKEAAIDLNQLSISRSPMSKTGTLYAPIATQVEHDTSGFGQLVGPKLLATTGASATPVNNDKPAQGEGVTIQGKDQWTKTWPEMIGSFLHLSVLDFNVIPKNAEFLRWFPSSDSIKSKGVTIGETIRVCLIPCVAVADVLCGKIRENGYGTVLTWLKRAIDLSTEDRPKSSEEYLRDISRQLKLQTDISK